MVHMLIKGNTEVSIFDLSKDYVVRFIKYTTSQIGEINSVREAYDLLSWSIKKIYDLEPSEYNSYIEAYGESCVENLKGVYTFKAPLSLEKRVNLLECTLAYFVAVTGIGGSIK